MPTTRKKVIKTVYKDEDDSEADNAAGDFSDSGSDAVISDQSSSDEEDVGVEAASEDEFVTTNIKRPTKPKAVKKTKFAKTFVNKINKQSLLETEEDDVTPVLFSVKDLTDAEKLLPFALNLSESDSSDDETPSTSKAKTKPIASTSSADQIPIQNETATEYKDVWNQNKQDNSEEIAKKTFMELEQHKAQLEAIKAKVMDYSNKNKTDNDSLNVTKKEPNVNDLLALGEEVTESPVPSPVKKKSKAKPVRDDSDSEIEDWEEVKETAAIPQQGLQLFVDFPDASSRKSKKVDVEMMMKRKINRVKKEHQVYMHKVHVLCWIGHGNYVSQVLNDQDILAAALSLIPSDECYPGERVDMKYLEQITKWYKDKLTLKQDKNENKFRPKAPPLKELLLAQMKSKVVTTKKYLVFVFVSMLRALGLQCRVMFNFVALPIKPPSSELCSLSTKKNETEKSASQQNVKVKKGTSTKIPQLDGIFDDSSESEFETIVQVDGSDDALTVNTRSRRITRKTSTKTAKASDLSEEDVIPTKKARKSPNPKAIKTTKSNIDQTNNTKDEKAFQNATDCENNSEKAVQSPSARKTKGSKSTKSETKKEALTSLDSPAKTSSDSNLKVEKSSPKVLSLKKHGKKSENDTEITKLKADIKPIVSPRKTRSNVSKTTAASNITTTKKTAKEKFKPPEIVINKPDEDTSIANKNNTEKLETNDKKSLSLSRKRSQTSNPPSSKPSDDLTNKDKTKSRTKSAPGTTLVKSEYFTASDEVKAKKPRTNTRQQNKKNEQLEDQQRVSHKDLTKARTKLNNDGTGDLIDVIKKRVEAKTDAKKRVGDKDQTKSKAKSKNDVTGDLIHIIKKRVEEAKSETKKLKVKGKHTEDSGDDSDFLPVESPKQHTSDIEDDFKPTKISPRRSSSKKIDRRVLSSDDDLPKNKVDVWCEVFVEELEQWIAVDIVKGKVHCADAIYNRATHPVCYTVGWDNSNCLKDLTRRYVPHWNTVTRKLRAEPLWWDQAIKPYQGPRTAREKEEDEGLDRMQLEAPLPKSIAEYKNHPLYALKRHLLKFEAIYPPDAATLGFVRGEAVYARDCIYTCRSRDTWLKEAKVVRLGEKPYKVVKARPKWDKLSNKLITDKPLEVFGPWQVKDYEPPVAENGMVPRNPYGNVELFKQCMLPKGTVHIKLPGLNRVAKKLNIDCAPAMTGFDFNGGWSHPVYDGFVVCQEFEEIVTEAWVKDQEEQLRREREKIDLRVYGNWKRLIKGLLIKERLKDKYGFQEPSTSQETKKKVKKPRLVVKK